MNVSHSASLAILVASLAEAAPRQTVLSVRVNLSAGGKNVTVPFVIEDAQGRRAGWGSDRRELREIPGADPMLMPMDDTGPGDPNGNDTDPSTYAGAVTLANPATAYEIRLQAPRAGALRVSIVSFGARPDKELGFEQRVAAHQKITLRYDAPKGPEGGERRPPTLKVKIPVARKPTLR